MTPIEELQKAISEKRAELKQLEADLPTIQKMNIAAHEKALTASRSMTLAKRLELHAQRQQLEAVLDQQQADIDATKDVIADLERELQAELDKAHIDEVATWAKRRTREGAEAFAKAYRELMIARDAFHEVDTKVTEEKAARPRDAYASKELSIDVIPPFAFRDCLVRGRGSARGTRRLDIYVKDLRDLHPDLFKGL